LKALDNPVGGVTSFKEESGRSSAAIDDSVFEVSLSLLLSREDHLFLKVPRSYDVLGGASENTRRQYQVSCCLFNKNLSFAKCWHVEFQGGGEEEEMMLQYAIRQSLAQPGDQVSC
jgi:hypothetical protein